MNIVYIVKSTTGGCIHQVGKVDFFNNVFQNKLSAIYVYTQSFILSGRSWSPHTMLAGRLSSIFLG